MSPRKAAAAKAVRSPAKVAAAAKPAAKVVAPKVVAAKAAANGGASAEATQLAARIERDLRDGKLDTLTPQAFQALMAALCKSYGTQLEAGADFLPVADRHEREPDRNHDNDERASEGRQSRGLRTRHVAELDGPLSARAAGIEHSNSEEKPHGPDC